MKKLFLYLMMVLVEISYLNGAALLHTPKIDSTDTIKGKCIIAAYFKETTRLCTSEIPPEEPWKGAIGRIELSWHFKAGKAPAARIDHLEVDPTNRQIGTGRSLFSAAINFLIGDLGITNITWAAQSVDSTVPLENLMFFYQKIGGEIVKIHDEYCASMRLSEKKAAEIMQSRLQKIMKDPTSDTSILRHDVSISHPLLTLEICAFSAESSPVHTRGPA